MKLYQVCLFGLFLLQVHCKPFAETEDDGSYTHKLLSELKEDTSLKFSSTEMPASGLSWEAAYDKANALIQGMTLEEKVNITTGLGWMTGRCVGNTGSASNFPELCLQDAPLGIRFADGVSSGVAGINAAASFDKESIRRRGEYMGAEFRAKGIHAQLGPSMNMMRTPNGGRNWEAFGEDPFLVGVAAAETIKGIQSQGVVTIEKEPILQKKLISFFFFFQMAVAKHLIGNEQETNRQVVKIELYLKKKKKN